MGGGGVDGAIHRAAGPGLLVECRQIGGCPTGEARITKGYRLPARYVIHTVGPVYKGKAQDQPLLTNCYRNSLELAQKYELKSVAFPAISCGVYGYPIEKACRVAVDTACEYLKHSAGLERIIFMLFSDEDKRIYTEYIGSL